MKSICFALEVAKGDVVIDRIEHDGFSRGWIMTSAIEMIYWESTRRALAAVADLPR
jgi:hypothetical protein